jgi:hypothetical protein
VRIVVSLLILTNKPILSIGFIVFPEPADLSPCSNRATQANTGNKWRAR